MIYKWCIIAKVRFTIARVYNLVILNEIPYNLEDNRGIFATNVFKKIVFSKLLLRICLSLSSLIHSFPIVDFIVNL